MLNWNVVVLTVASLIMLSFSGCSKKNITIEKANEKVEIKSVKTFATANAQYVQIENDIEGLKSYETRECGNQTVYHGFAYNYLRIMFGQRAYTPHAKVKSLEPNNARIFLWWLGSPIALPFFTAVEIISLQPFYDYGTRYICDSAKSEKSDIQLTNNGSFSGLVKMRNDKKEQAVNFNFDNEPLPLKLSLQDESDMFAVSKRTIDSLDGYLVDIDGVYNIDGSSSPVKETIKIRE